MYKLVAMDLDETLLNDKHQICERNKKAIQKAKALGVKIIPCSGRGPGFLGTILDELDLESDEEYSILANGAVIVKNKTNEIIHCDPLDYNIMKKLFDFGCQKNLCIQIFTPEFIYFYYCPDSEKERCKSFGKNFIFRNNNNIEDLQDKVIFKILFMKEDMNYLLSLEKELTPITENRISISFSSNRYLELNAYGVNKGKGLNHLAQHLNIDIKETIGIGDNFNDIQLIEEAGLGVAVSNAKEQVKAIANYICESNNNDGGVAETIEKFLLNAEE